LSPRRVGRGWLRWSVAMERGGGMSQDYDMGDETLGNWVASCPVSRGGSGCPAPWERSFLNGEPSFGKHGAGPVEDRSLGPQRENLTGQLPGVHG
jgi:hypothetical protein